MITVPGAIPLLLARSLGSLPIGMVPLGIILLLRAGGRSYALAGIADGAYALGVAAMQPMLGRLIDRVGMGRVLAPLAIVFPGMLVALALVASSGAPAAATVGLALLSGATMPPLGACMRALWPTLIASPALRPTAYAIDATLQELAFVVGPPLLALLVAVGDPETALFGAAAVGGAGAVLFASRAHARHEPTRRAGGALRSAGVRRVLAMSAVLGGAFGATEVAMPAFCERHGARPAAGLLLARRTGPRRLRPRRPRRTARSRDPRPRRAARAAAARRRMPAPAASRRSRRRSAAAPGCRSASATERACTRRAAASSHR